MIELSEYKRDAFRVLDGLMDSFTTNDGEREFICPMLEHFWPRLTEILLPNNGLEGALILQDWGNATQPTQQAIRNVEHATTAKVLDRKESDRTLFNLFRPESKWREPLIGGWIVMNAVWGTRLSKDDKEADQSECLPSKIHYPALAIWGKLILDLHDKCPFKQLVLAGSWARFVTPYEKGRRVSGPRYFQEWSKRISKSRIDEDQKRESGAIAEELKALEGQRV